MRSEDCYEMSIDRHVYDVIVSRFGAGAAAELTAEVVDEIRAEAFGMMGRAVKDLDPVEGLFDEAIEYVYRLKYVF